MRYPNGFFLNKCYLQLRYAIRVYLSLPKLFFKEVFFSKNDLSEELFWQKLGFLPKEISKYSKEQNVIWIEALGGEVCQLVTYTKLIKENFPHSKIALSTYNIWAYHFAKTIKTIDYVFMTPYELSGCIKRVLKRLNPKILVVVDLALFPVILEQARKRNVGLVLLSSSLAKDYYENAIHMKRSKTWQYFRHFDYIGTCGEWDKETYIAIGADPNRITVTGNMKFDLDYLKVSDSEKVLLRRKLHINDDDYIIVAGSIHPGEEVILLNNFSKLHESIKKLKMVIVPRHNEFIGIMEGAAHKLSLSFSRQSQLMKSKIHSESNIIFIDSFGELNRLYSIANINFIGNSVISKDKFALGQNIIEPIVQGKPIFFGPYMNKWHYLTEQLKSVCPYFEVRDESDFYRGVTYVYKNREIEWRVQQKCREIMEENENNVYNNFLLTKKALEKVLQV